ncbi:hypothetical protein HU200_065222 [Digitaria exilis]|uniref:Uncharacterized protein n=1 Tax=Digitaria exilis TaxID=1010633 RepID=A0A834ZYQ7_9POAL|nr:hypothetical protein HU200_065222 [Digitaria exilis]
MGDMATLRMARQELEDLYLGVPDDSVDLTFKDLASSSLPAPATATSNLPKINEASDAASVADAVAADGHQDERKKTTAGGALARSSTNIFTYRPLEDHHYSDAVGGGAGGGGHGVGGGGALLQLSPSPAHPHQYEDDDEDDQHQYHYGAGAAGTTNSISRSAGVAGDGGGGRRNRRLHVADDTAGGRHRSSGNYKRPGIPHSNICALCNSYVCGRVYCRRCVAGGMGDMTEGRKCIDCLGRRYSHRYIHRAGDTSCGFCCFWGYYPNAKAVTAQELIWAEKGPAPRRRPRPAGSSTSYGGGSGYYSSTNTVASASMSMSMAMNNSDGSIAMVKMKGGGGGYHDSVTMPASASSSFVASFPHNPHAFPL